MASRSARPTVTAAEILDAHTPAVRALAEAAFALIRSIVPEATERGYPGWHAIGFRHPAVGYFCGVFPFKDDVRLIFEHGARLADALGLLEGETRQTRHVVLGSLDALEAKRAGLEALLKESVGLGNDRIPLLGSRQGGTGR